MFLDSNIGKLEITYLGKYINNCARYQYSFIMTWQEIKKTFRKLDFYHVTMYLEQDNNEQLKFGNYNNPTFYNNLKGRLL